MLGCMATNRRSHRSIPALPVISAAKELVPGKTKRTSSAINFRTSSQSPSANFAVIQPNVLCISHRLIHRASLGRKRSYLVDVKIVLVRENLSMSRSSAPSRPPARTSYHHGDLRRALIDAALQDIAASGPANLSLRALARSAGVSHAAPAHHFRDKSGVFTAIATEGFQLASREPATHQRGMWTQARPFSRSLSTTSSSLSNIPPITR